MSRLVTLLAAISLLAPGVAGAQAGAQGQPRVTGVVKKLDIELGTITVRPNREGAIDETFSLLKKEIDVKGPSGSKVPLAAVKPGQTVQLQAGPTGDIDAIAIKAEVFLATVSQISVEKRTIAIAAPPDRFTTMAVDPAAKILLAGRPAYLREIKPGSEMKLTPSLDGKTVLALNLVSDPDGKHAAKLFPRIKVSRLPGSRFAGILTDIDAAKNEVKLLGPKTKNVPKPLPVAKDAVIKLVHGQVAVQDIPLRQLVAPAQAVAMVAPQTQEVTHILVAPPVIQGKVKLLNPERGLLTAEVDSAERTFTLPPGIKVMNKSRVRRLAELEPGVTVNLVLSLDRDRLLAIDTREPVSKP